MLFDVENWMNDFVMKSALNVAPELNNIQIFDLPLIGIASANDPMFRRFKEPDGVGELHLSPEEWLQGSQTVISYFLPFTEEVRAANRTPGDPAIEWLFGRIEGQVFNNALSRTLAEKLIKKGYKALVPAQDPRFAIVNRRSNWSERHVAFVAGLGTISLNRSLITKRGSAGRIGSIVTSLQLQETPRYYEAFDENCNHCGACIKRCPPQAIDATGKNHAVCELYLEETKQRYQPRYGCGKCQTAVPCEKRIPDRIQSKK